MGQAGISNLAALARRQMLAGRLIIHKPPQARKFPAQFQQLRNQLLKIRHYWKKIAALVSIDHFLIAKN